MASCNSCLMSHLIALALTINVKQHHRGSRHIQCGVTKHSFCNHFAWNRLRIDTQPGRRTIGNPQIFMLLHLSQTLNLLPSVCRMHLKRWYLVFVYSAAKALCSLPFCCLCDGIPPRKWTAVNESTKIKGKFCSWSYCFVKKRLVWTGQKRNLFSVRFRGFHCSSDVRKSRRAGRGRSGGGSLLLDEARKGRGVEALMCGPSTHYIRETLAPLPPFTLTQTHTSC